MSRTALTHLKSSAISYSIYYFTCHRIALVIEQTSPACIQVFLKYRCWFSAVPKCIFHVYVGILSVLRPLVALKTPMLLVCIHPSNRPFRKYITYLIRILAWLNFNLSWWTITRVLITNTRTQILIAGYTRTELRDVNILVVNLHLGNAEEREKKP